MDRMEEGTHITTYCLANSFIVNLLSLSLSQSSDTVVICFVPLNTLKYHRPAII